MTNAILKEAEREWQRCMEKMQAGEDVSEDILRINKQGGLLSKAFSGKKFEVKFDSNIYS